MRKLALALAILCLASPAAAQSVRFEARYWPVSPTSPALVFPLNTPDALTIFGTLPSPPGYGDACVDSAANMSAVNLLGGTSGQNHAYHYGMAFTVSAALAGTWSFRAGVDFGFGGAILLDGNVLQARWPSSPGSTDTDMWWAGGFFNPSQFLQGSAPLTAGNHLIEVIGYDGCCDGGQELDFQLPGSPLWQVVSDTNPATPGLDCSLAVGSGNAPAGPIGPTGPVGPAGLRGLDGATGPPGPPGSIGPTGPIGPLGPQGPAGPIGPQGPGFTYRGQFAAAITYAENDVVTSQGGSYVAGPSASGDPAGVGAVGWRVFAPRGETGPRGDAGMTGVGGVTGPQGDPGATGQIGPQGIAGATGAAGPQGFAGAAGAAGVAGIDGAPGAQGARGPAGLTGVVGAIGPQGASGVTGAAGPAGPQGFSGSNGVNGTNGLNGGPGPAGAVGIGLDVEIRRIQTDQVLTMGSSNRNVVYLVKTAPSSVNLTLPLAANATGRMITIQRVDTGRKVTVRAQGNELVDGARVPIVLDSTFDAVTLASDGAEWIVFVLRTHSDSF